MHLQYVIFLVAISPGEKAANVALELRRHCHAELVLEPYTSGRAPTTTSLICTRETSTSAATTAAAASSTNAVKAATMTPSSPPLLCTPTSAWGLPYSQSYGSPVLARRFPGTTATIFSGTTPLALCIRISVPRPWAGADRAAHVVDVHGDAAAAFVATASALNRIRSVRRPRCNRHWN